MKTHHIRKLVFSAMFAALVFTATWLSIPNGLGGNINLGDCMLLIGAWTLGGPWAVVACALGAMLTDWLSGYVIYAPATFVIKALMVIVALLVQKLTAKRPAVVRYILSGIAAELIMVLGYFAYETIIYSLPAAVAGVPFNLIQAGAAVLVANLLMKLLSHAKLQDVLKK